MELKDYQTKVLEDLSRYLAVLAEKRTDAEGFVEYQASKGKLVKLADYCRETWDELNNRRLLPLLRDEGGNAVVPSYIGRKDGVGEPVPNVCLKVPTGGGKTLLAACALERINDDYFHRQTGLVLWIVPSDAIYTQTWKALANREHTYRQLLERASGGRVKMLEKSDAFTVQDIEQSLCVMLLMLPAANRQTKDTLRMFRDSGAYPSFFPESDDTRANAALVQRVPNLDENDMADCGFMPGTVSLKQSLGNVLRLVRPIVVIDEGHKAYSELALNTLAGFNPRFILELSATPNANKHISNVLVNVSGGDLKKEQMIKLPINLDNTSNADWQHILALAKDKLDSLARDADGVQAAEGRYIRPIMLIRVDRTGKEQRDGHHIHAEDIREHLTAKLGVPPEAIRLKTAELDEIDKEDLLASECPVRFIITKAALQEGWDCPFAYVLTVLSRMTATTALTQMIGRVLRQPGALTTTRQTLNECYVFTMDEEMKKAVDSVRKGLEDEGMADLANQVRVSTAGVTIKRKTATLTRREQFKGLRIFLPRVLSRDPYAEGEAFREMDYERDILPGVDWESLHFRDAETWTPDASQKIEHTKTKVDVEGELGLLPGLAERHEVETPERLDFAFLVRLMLDVIPNPFQGARILHEALAVFAKRGFDEKALYPTRLALIHEMKNDLRKQVHESAETYFRERLAKGEISFRLLSAGDPKLNWELAETLELDLNEGDSEFSRKDSTPLERSLFEKLYEADFNNLEKNVAWHVDASQTVHWWHRIAARQDYALQGWQRQRVYPDFLVCLQSSDAGRFRFSMLETKGEHLSGSADTDYKRRLFDVLTAHSQAGKALRTGELSLGLPDAEMRFEMLMEDNWNGRLAPMLS